MAVDGGGRLEWAQKFLVWIKRFGVSFQVLPESRRGWVLATRANAFRDFNFPPAPLRLLHLRRHCPPFPLTVQHFRPPARAPPALLLPPISRADMCIGDAYGAAHVVDGEDS